MASEENLHNFVFTCHAMGPVHIFGILVIGIFCQLDVKVMAQPEAPTCAVDQGTKDDGTAPSRGTPDVGEEPQINERVGTPVEPQPDTCGGAAYDKSVSTCCNGVVTLGISIENNPNVQCCGRKAFDSSKLSCCQADRPVGTRWGPNRSCCGIHAIDKTQFICCQGKRFSAKHSDRCCAKDGYNSATEVCCRKNGKSHARKGNACCNGQPFDNNNNRKICCGTANLKTMSGAGARLCCGNVIYDPQRETCCNGVQKLAKKEDVTAIFDVICCGGFNSTISPSMKCCDGVLYSTYNEICCHGKTFENIME